MEIKSVRLSGVLKKRWDCIKISLNTEPQRYRVSHLFIFNKIPLWVCGSVFHSLYFDIPLTFVLRHPVFSEKAGVFLSKAGVN